MLVIRKITSYDTVVKKGTLLQVTNSYGTSMNSYVLFGNSSSIDYLNCGDDVTIGNIRRSFDIKLAEPVVVD
jgi:hypothetical protein